MNHVFNLKDVAAAALWHNVEVRDDGTVWVQRLGDDDSGVPIGKFVLRGTLQPDIDINEARKTVKEVWL